MLTQDYSFLFGFSFFHFFFPLSAFLREFPLPFASIFPVYPSFCFAGLCIVTCGSPFSSPLSARSLLLRGFTAFLAVRLCRSSFLVGFLSFASFCLRFFHLHVAILFPCWCIRFAFSCFSLDFFFSFLFLSYSLVSLPLFCLLLCSSWLRVSLCVLLCFPFCSSYARCLSSSGGFLQSFPGFVRYFPCKFDLLVIVSSVFFDYVSFFLCLWGFTVRFSCVFLNSFGAFPVLFEFHSSSSDASWSSCVVFASLQSWASLLHVLFSVSGLLVGPHSLLVLLSVASICVCLLPLFCLCLSLLFLLVAASVVARLLSCSMTPFFGYCRYLGVSILSPCVPVLFSSVPLFQNKLVFLFRVWSVCSSLIAQCPWCLFPRLTAGPSSSPT